MAANHGTHAQQQDIIMAHGADHLPSETASDWITYADHVAVVTVASEADIPPTQQEIARGEGLIGRELTLDVEEVLWSRDGARSAPETWAYSALGYQFKDGDLGNRTKMAMTERPRVESGHQYIMAMVWENARCSPGDIPSSAGWRGLGEGSEVPFDDDVIGKGELEGTVRSEVSALRAAAVNDSQTASLEEELAGQSSEALVQALTAAAPRQPAQQFKAAPPAENACN